MRNGKKKHFYLKLLFRLFKNIILALSLHRRWWKIHWKCH